MTKDTLTSKEIVELASHQYATIKDIELFGECCKDKAYEHMHILRELIRKKYGGEVVFPTGKVHMEDTMAYFHVNEKRHIQILLALGGVVNGR